MTMANTSIAPEMKERKKAGSEHSRDGQANSGGLEASITSRSSGRQRLGMMEKMKKAASEGSRRSGELTALIALRMTGRQNF
jgi:hypothetical protein